MDSITNKLWFAVWPLGFEFEFGSVFVVEMWPVAVACVTVA